MNFHMVGKKPLGGLLFLGAVAFGLLNAPLACAADAYPAEPVKIIVPFSPGGGVDNVARIIAQQLSSVLKQSVVVDNKPGASGNIAAAYVARAKPDGYTLLMASSILAVQYSLGKNMQFDAIEDLAEVGRVGYGPYVLVTPSSLPIKNLKDFEAYAQQHPQEIFYGSPGVGSGHQLNGLMLADALKLDNATHIPYKGGALALTDLLAGRLTYMFAIKNEVTQFIQQGRLTPLAITGTTPAADLPKVPTLKGLGLPDEGFTTWWGLMAPAGTPASVVQKVEAALAQVMNDPNTQKSLQHISVTPGFMDAKTFTAFFKSDAVRYEQLIKSKNIEAQ